MLRVRYLGRTSFLLESKDTSVILNPGIWNGTPQVPDNLDVRVIVATSQMDDALGNAASIAANSKAWILGNLATIEKAKSQGAKPWLLHELSHDVQYTIPGLSLTPVALQRLISSSRERVESLGLYIEMGGIRVAYLGDTCVRGPFGQMPMDVLIVPVGGGDSFEVKDAVALCVDAKPRLGIPMRWTTDEQPLKFERYVKQFAQGCVPLLMQPGQTVEIQWAAGHEFKHQLLD